MPVSLDVDAAHHYTEALDGIEVPITLSTGRQSIEFLAKLDTGAAHFLGRSGWLDRLRIAILDYARLRFVSPYQS
jgi:hypothetical protein